MTEAEQLLWTFLRRKQLGHTFYRQKPLLNYVVDFYCPAALLVIECDGSQHQQPEHLAQDVIRDEALQALGIDVLRFDNRQVLQQTEMVLSHIRQAIQKKERERNPP